MRLRSCGVLHGFGRRCTGHNPVIAPNLLIVNARLLPSTRQLRGLIGSTGALVERPLAGAAAERAIAERGAARLLRHVGRGTVGAGHRFLLHAASQRCHGTRALACSLAALSEI